MENVIIPRSLQITMDDVGWFNGSDDRKNGGSARTAMCRRHCAADYAAINELGRRLDMKINCGFVIGEWDDDDRLRRIPYLSKFGDGWNNSAYLGKDEMRAVADTVNASPYIDIAVHGLMHNYYRPDASYSNTDYYCKRDGSVSMIPEREVRARLDAFFGILDRHGIEKRVNSFIPPNFTYVWDSISRILGDYGIGYISTVFTSVKWNMGEGFVPPKNAALENGIITFNRNVNFVPWYEISTDLDAAEPVSGIFGCHWPNILHADASRNGEIADSWVRYFKRCSETYGIILSKDIAFAATQTLYSEYAVVRCENGRAEIDVSGVPESVWRLGRFYISARTDIKSVSGGTVSLYEDKGSFRNYEVVPCSDVITFEL